MSERDLRPATRLLGICLAGVLASLTWECASGAIRTVPKGSARGSQGVRDAVQAPTEQGQVEALIRVMNGGDLPAALEAMDVLASMGPRVVPRLVSEMRAARNNWLIGAALAKMGAPAVEPLLELIEQEDTVTTVDCLYLLGEIQDRRAIPTLVRYLEDPRERVRMYAVTALLRIGGPRAVEAVLSRLNREGKSLESFIVEAVLRYGQKSVEPILQNLKSPNPRVRKEAAYLLGGLGDARASESLESALRDPDAGVRRNAAHSLGMLSRAITEPDFVILSLTGALADPDAEVVVAATQSLVSYGSRSVQPLIGVCRAGRAEERMAALNALRDIGDAEAEGVMVESLRHPDRRVRVLAVAGLISVGTGRAVEPLLDALRDDDLKWFAALALEKVGPENLRALLMANSDDPTMNLRIQILSNLGPKVVPVLLEQLRGDNLGRKAVVVWILGEIGDETCAREVGALLDDSQLGWLAGRSLARMGDVGLTELLRRTRAPMSEGEAVQIADALALFDDAKAWDFLERSVSAALPRAARVRSAVLLSLRGEAERVERLRAYLDAGGRDLWPDVKAALRAEGQIQ